MIGKPLTKPIIIDQLEAALRRTPENHCSRPSMELDLAKNRSGYRGQQSLDYYFNFLDEKEYWILNDLRLPYKDKYFQIDATILCKYFISLLEVKNNGGTLEFDLDLHQFIQRYNEKTFVYPDPIQQVERQRFQLNEWMKKMKLQPIPIEGNVVVSNPSALILPPPPHHRQFFKEKIIRSPSIKEKIDYFQKKYKKEVYTQQEIRRIIKGLLKSHTPKIENILDQYRISTTEMRTGVHCPNCSKLPMKRDWGLWYCPDCRCISSDAHLPAIKDFSLLYGVEITNRQLCNFLHITPSIANKILHSMKLPYTGTTKDRIHMLPPLDEG